MIFSIPIVAILSNTFLKWQKVRIEADGGGNAGLLAAQAKRLAEQEAYIQELSERVKNLEVLASESDMRTLPEERQIIALRAELNQLKNSLKKLEQNQQ